VVVDPSVIAVSHQPPPVVIQKIIADDSSITFGMTGSDIPKRVRIPPGRGELEIQYAALSYTDPDKNVYKYKLDGVNAEWVNVGNIRVAKYYNLHPGKYRFQITACNNDGIWNPEGRSVELILEPHFWQTWWFLSLCILAAVGAVSGVARFVTRYKMQKKLTQLEQQRAVERERARIARDVHDELGARLTRISYQGGIAKLSLKDAAGIEQHIDQMSAAAREAVSSLHEIIWAADPQNDSLEGLLGHIGHYAEEFFNACGIRSEVITPKFIPGHHISARVRHDLFLAVKEAMNNAAKHANPGRVLIQIEIRAKEFEIVVTDDGCGFDQDWTGEGPGKASHSGYHGLSNMHERLRNIHGKCAVESRKGRGTVVRFTIPLHEELS
jgi:signal transduction histidine kinase